jgi:hypothetical protein
MYSMTNEDRKGTSVKKKMEWDGLEEEKKIGKVLIENY